MSNFETDSERFKSAIKDQIQQFTEAITKRQASNEANLKVLNQQISELKVEVKINPDVESTLNELRENTRNASRLLIGVTESFGDEESQANAINESNAYQDCLKWFDDKNKIKPNTISAKLAFKATIKSIQDDDDYGSLVRVFY